MSSPWLSRELVLTCRRRVGALEERLPVASARSGGGMRGFTDRVPRGATAACRSRRAAPQSRQNSLPSGSVITMCPAVDHESGS